MVINVLLQFLKWKVVCNSLLNISDNKKILKSLFYGFSAGIITPVRVGEYLGRKLALEEVGLLKVTISTIVEKFASLFIVLIVGSIATIYFIYLYYNFFYSIPVLLFVSIILIIFTLFIFGYKPTSSFFQKLANRINIIKQLEIELEYARKMNRNDFRLLMLYSLLFYFVIIMQYALLALAFEQEGNVLLFLIAGIIVLFIKSIFSFLSFADLGIRESTSVFLVGKMGYSNAVGFNSAIFLFLFNLVIPSLIGMFLLLKRSD